MPTADLALPIAVEPPAEVSALLRVPAEASAALVLAHGAGAGMEHPFMQALAEDLAACKVATLRFQFPYMEQHSRRPDPPAIAQGTVRAAVLEAARRLPGLPLFAGGKSFGGRMTSQAHAEDPLPGVLGLVFVGFPLHPAGNPSIRRAAHLAAVHLPMLFLQGSRDALAEPALLGEALAPVRERASLEMFDDADHAFHVRKRSGMTDAQVIESLARRTAGWMSVIAGRHA